MYKHTILFVDDTKFILKTLNEILKNEKFNKLYANNAEEALEIIEEVPIDAIIADILMPEINGIQLLKMVKEKHPEIVRVALSGSYNPTCIIEAINSAEVYRYLTKPLNLSENYKKTFKDILEHSDYLKCIKL